MERQRERDRFLQALLDKKFFQQWRSGEVNLRANQIEFQVTYDCNLSCKYCYVNRHGEELCEPELRDNERVLNNTNLLLDWIEDNGFRIPRWEIFSGSLFSQKIGHQVVDAMYDKLANTDKKKIRPETLVIPTNGTFLLDEETTRSVEKYIEKFEELGVHVHLSLSVEGKYMEQNRPFDRNFDLGEKSGQHLFVPQERGEEYYDKVFDFAQQYGFGFHPMVYSDGIDKWKKNFLWFQDKFREFGIDHHNIFLLEVRNEEWSDAEIQEFKDFMRFVDTWVYQNVAEGSPEKMKQYLQGEKLINTLKMLVGQDQKSGTPCSIQGDLQVRLGDLHFGPCHRMEYPGMEFGRFEVEDDTIVDIKALNAEMAMGIYSMDHETLPGCMTCPINAICSKSCFGANMEYVGEPFMPSPKVCQLGYAKALGHLEFMKGAGIFSDVLQIAGEDIARAYRRLDDVAEEV